jgi:hypothetical protein
MKKLILYFALPVAVLLHACVHDPAASNTQQSNSTTQSRSTKGGIQMAEDENPEWQHGTLRLYPITADEELMAMHSAQAGILTLEEAMQLNGFRITERKNFGREQETWYNGLTVVNKSTEPVFMMSGDVVTGGNQDRVNEQDLMAMPGTIQNFDVFCVEAGRSHYYDGNASPAERKIGAFNGYYAVASPRVRSAVYKGDQQAVWGAVAQVTKEYNAETTTHTYAALGSQAAQDAQRDAYVQFFSGKFEAMDKAVGLVAVCNGKVIGAEVFGHPNLFQRRVKALIQSYAVDAAKQEVGQRDSKDNQPAKAVFERLTKAAEEKAGEGNTGCFVHNGQWLHLYSKPVH